MQYVVIYAGQMAQVIPSLARLSRGAPQGLVFIASLVTVNFTYKFILVL